MNEDPTSNSWASDFLKLQQTSPLRPVNWRQRLVLRLISGQLVPEDWVDSWTDEAARFQRALELCQSDADHHLLAEQMPDQYRAHQVRVSEPQSMRWEIEARLLAGESCTEIAQHFGIPAAVVEWYERVYFNVSDRLEHRGYIVHIVIGPKLQHGLRPRDVDVIWKIYGYFGGVHVLRHIIDTFPAPAPEHPEDVEAFLRHRNEAVMVCQASQAARMVAVNAETAPELVKQHFEWERATANQRRFDENSQPSCSASPPAATAEQPAQGADPLVSQRIELEAKRAVALSVPLETERGRLRFLKLYQDHELARERLRHAEWRLQQREAEAQRRHEIAQARLEKAQQREERRAAEFARKEEKARAREFVAWQERVREQQECRAREEAVKVLAAASPLVELCWAAHAKKTATPVVDVLARTFFQGRTARPPNLATTVHCSLRLRSTPRTSRGGGQCATAGDLKHARTELSARKAAA